MAAECAAMMIEKYKDSSLVPLVQELAWDPSNIVRMDVCKSLRRLADYDYGSAYEIALEYSLDRDRRVQFFIPDMLGVTAAKNPSHMLRILENIVHAGSESEEVSYCLLYWTLVENEPKAASMLDATIEKPSGKKLCMHIPFQLKPYMEKFRDKALGLFYRLLDHADHEVREKACFFLLGWAEDNMNDRLPAKIERHLDRIAAEARREPYDPRLLEELVRFLEKFWTKMPGKSIECLEKITRLKEYAAGQPVLAEESLKILSGLLYRPLSGEETRRCLDILDVYAMAGWPDALGLLSAMERRD